MPYTQVYEDITRKCGNCGQTLVASEIKYGSLFLRSVLYCRTCNGCWTLDYLFRERCYVDKQLRADEVTWGISWACDCGCEWLCHATRIEVSVRFLQISFRCYGCRGSVARYYDLERHGFADVTGRITPLAFPYSQLNHNRTRYVGVKECDGMENCPRGQVRSLSDLAKLTQSDQIGGIVATVVENCPGMDAEQIAGCFGRLFGTAPVHISERTETTDRRNARRDLFQRLYKSTDDVQSQRLSGG